MKTNDRSSAFSREIQLANGWQICHICTRVIHLRIAVSSAIFIFSSCVVIPLSLSRPAANFHQRRLSRVNFAILLLDHNAGLPFEAYEPSLHEQTCIAATYVATKEANAAKRLRIVTG